MLEFVGVPSAALRNRVPQLSNVDGEHPLPPHPRHMPRDRWRCGRMTMSSLEITLFYFWHLFRNKEGLGAAHSGRSRMPRAHTLSLTHVNVHADGLGQHMDSGYGRLRRSR